MLGGPGVETTEKGRRRHERKLIFDFFATEVCFGSFLAVSGFEPKYPLKCLSRRRKAKFFIRIGKDKTGRKTIKFKSGKIYKK